MTQMEKKNKEAATLQKKKTTITKSKVKKSIKNILCRPDPVFWPAISEEQVKILEETLSAYKVEIPVFNKLHWKILKEIPKDQRPKQPKIKKVEGLIFGISDCTEAVKGKQCSAVIIEAAVNPRTLVQPLIEDCITIQLPVLCINGLKKITSHNFGIPTSCLAVKHGFLQELISKVEGIAKLHQPPQTRAENEKNDKEQPNIDNAQGEIDIDMKQEKPNDITRFTYLYRTSKKTRIFNPSSEEPKAKKAFVGQDFIELCDKSEQKKVNKAYKSMIVKRITNNQNRVKRK